MRRSSRSLRRTAATASFRRSTTTRASATRARARPTTSAAAYSSPPDTKTPHWIVYGRILDPHAVDTHLSGLGSHSRCLSNAVASSSLTCRASNGRPLTTGTARYVSSSGGGVVNTAAGGSGRRRRVRLRQPLGRAGGPGDSCNGTYRRRSSSRSRRLAARRAHALQPRRDLPSWRHDRDLGSAEHLGPDLFLDLAGPQPTQDSANWPDCNPSASRWSASRPIDGQSSAGLVNGDHYVNMVRGFVDPRSGIVSMSLESPSGAKNIAFAGGAYIAELPNSPRVGNGPGPIPGGPYTLVGYDARGARVAAVTIRGQPVP